MDGGAIMKRDLEFAQINSELDLKAEFLLKEIETVMHHQQEQDIQESILMNTKNTEHEQEPHKSERSFESKSLEGQKKLNHETAEIRFLQAKLKILSTEMERQQSDFRRKASEWRAREGEMRAFKEERDQTVQQNASLHQQVARLTANIKEQSTKLQRIEAENLKLSTEVQAARKETKNSTQKASTLEIRLNRMVEDGENLRAALRNQQQREKEEHEEQRRTKDKQTAAIQRLERQRNELASAFRRQMLLCHNLQRQRDLLVAGAATEAARTQFDSLLEANEK